ncbi:MAG: diaminopimelate epimerase [Alphaproteobacteria bacterium]|nr:diaminopimelate epimerase [Alphaproteobacteria bacterium]
MALSFVKMHGLGNDFVVLDARATPVHLSMSAIQTICDRRFGIGCDQLIIIEPSARAAETIDCFMRIYNPDGSEAESCGNATRCIAWRLMEETGRNSIAIKTLGGLLSCTRTADGRVSVDMGAPIFDWQQIPLSKEVDVMDLSSVIHHPASGMAVSMGNPHAVFVVKDAEAIHWRQIGAALEHHALFPQRANISFAEVVSPQHIALRVWERGAGATLACGTAACAALVACAKKGLTGRFGKVSLPGGDLDIRWDEATGHVIMTGGVAFVFEGVWHGSGV